MRRAIAAALILGAAAAMGACRQDKGAAFDCVCTSLTDWDDTTKQAVTICAASPDVAEGVAQNCARTSAPAPVQGCSCTPAGGGACVAGACRLR